MKRAIVSILCLTLALCLAPAGALAFNNYALDVDSLKAVEQTDAFGVKITRKVVTDGVSTDSLYNNDMLSFEITNDTEHEIAQLVVLAVCHDAEGKAQPLTNEGLSMIVGREKRTLQVLTFEPTGAAPGAVVTVSVACDHDGFTGVRALVAQYTTAEGEAVTNPLYEQWQEVALGSPTHILD